MADDTESDGRAQPSRQPYVAEGAGGDGDAAGECGTAGEPGGQRDAHPGGGLHRQQLRIGDGVGGGLGRQTGARADVEQGSVPRVDAVQGPAQQRAEPRPGGGGEQVVELGGGAVEVARRVSIVGGVRIAGRLRQGHRPAPSRSAGPCRG
ncbi:hypothetical protein CA983_21730 [Streptomyces swartbergensis]|uniref:Uncharacterized protein n=1 Tax=Streptomyces swartbergensis TaxID=487165 RepID=A0A243S2N4_9ACTN|nr:hypothetical protein CA983_21730 [Streptomyces swartbergensis]